MTVKPNPETVRAQQEKNDVKPPENEEQNPETDIPEGVETIVYNQQITLPDGTASVKQHRVPRDEWAAYEKEHGL